MKTVKSISILTLLFIMLIVVRCKDDAPAPLVKITGKVTYTNPSGQAANAAGAVVYLAKSAVATTTYDQTTIADANGVYTFSNLSADSYFLNAIYKTDNKNISARLDGLTFTTVAGELVTVANVDVTQDIALVSVGQTGTAITPIVANYAWDATALKFAQPAAPAWQLDPNHSMVTFEFPYRGAEGDFNGSFKQINKFVVNFDPANLAASTIDVEVDMASIDTRTPGGRDNRTTVADNPSFDPTTMFTELGCIAGTFGIAGDNGVPSDAVPQAITTSTNRYAKFKSTSIANYGDGYVAKGNLVFHGFTVPVELLFKAVAPWLDASNSRTYSGFEGRLVMKAKADYGISSTSVNDAIIKIQISIVGYK